MYLYIIIHIYSGGFRNLLRGVQDFARRRRARFFAPPWAIFAPPWDALRGVRKLLRGVRKKKRAKLAQGGAKVANGGGDGQTLINRHNTVIKPFKFSRKGLGVLDNFLTHKRGRKRWLVTFSDLLGRQQSQLIKNYRLLPNQIFLPEVKISVITSLDLNILSTTKTVHLPVFKKNGN